jgi:hypothetical protein
MFQIMLVQGVVLEHIIIFSSRNNSEDVSEDQQNANYTNKIWKSLSLITVHKRGEYRKLFELCKMQSSLPYREGASTDRLISTNSFIKMLHTKISNCFKHKVGLLLQLLLLDQHRE